MNLFIIRISDRPLGFRVVAVIAANEAKAKRICGDNWGAQFETFHARNFAEVADSCPAVGGRWAELEFEE